MTYEVKLTSGLFLVIVPDNSELTLPVSRDRAVSGEVLEDAATVSAIVGGT